MKKKLATGVAIATVAAFGIGPAGASAAHCVSPEGDSPGFSYFGNDHVQETDHNGAAPGQPEGGKNGRHAGTSGASNCNDAANPSPSTRAPGKA
jgi:hypothetical protein